MQEMKKELTETDAMLELVSLSEKDFQEGRSCSARELLEKRRKAQKNVVDTEE